VASSQAPFSCAPRLFAQRALSKSVAVRSLRIFANITCMARSASARARRANDSARLAAHCAHQLLRLRADTGETQKQLAARLQMTESMISRLERGDHLPSLKTLCRIADAFALRVSIVFDASDPVSAGKLSLGDQPR
jgi:HTH-type transcriptional regulator / antitoxin HipB